MWIEIITLVLLLFVVSGATFAYNKANAMLMRKRYEEAAAAHTVLDDHKEVTEKEPLLLSSDTSDTRRRSVRVSESTE